MTGHIPTTALVDYLAGDGSDEIEEHLFECEACAAAAADLAAIADGVARAMADGKARVVGNAELIARLEADGARLRHYHVAPGERLECYVAEDDLFVVAHYAADFTGVDRVDIVVTDEAGGLILSLRDVPVGPGCRVLPVLIRGQALRQAPAGDHHVRLLAGERVVAEYIFAHEVSLR
jgi:hypothetical protein